MLTTEAETALAGLTTSRLATQADYEVVVVPTEEAHRAVGDAATVVETVHRWLRRTHSP